MTDHDRSTRARLDATDNASGPTDEQRARMRARIAASVGASFALPVGASIGRSWLARLAGTSVTQKLVAGVLVVGAAAGAVRAATVRTTSTPVPRSAVARAAITDAPPRIDAPPSTPTQAPQRALGTVAIDTDTDTDTDAGALARSPRERAPQPASTSLARESALVAQADRALRTGQPALALVLVDEHAERFARGQLRHERETVRVLALCGLGRNNAALQAAAPLRSARGALPHRLERSCVDRDPPR